MVRLRIDTLSRWLWWNPSRVGLLGLFCLTAGFWAATSSLARSREASPAQLIQEGLPRRKTIATADKRELTKAICRAVTRHRNAAAAITSAAVSARKELAGEITATVLGCAGKIDCDFVARIVAAAGHTTNVSKDAIADAAVARASDCADAIERALRPVIKEPSPSPAKPENGAASAVPKPGADEGFDPLEPLRLVCDSGNQRTVRVSQVDEFLRTHPGAILGECPATPSPSPSPSAAATLLPAILMPSPTPQGPESSPAPH